MLTRTFRSPGSPRRLVVSARAHLGGMPLASTIVDSFSRRVVGRAKADHLRTELPLTALHISLARRHPAAR
jgi:transposase InsO family protein